MIPFPRSRPILRSGALVGAIVFLAAGGLQAQQTGTVTGRVTDSQSGQPIASVQIFIEGLDLGVLTQQNGRYLLQNVPTGTHTLTAERIGYRTGTQEITVAAGETVVQNFSIGEEALQLDEVVVTGTPGGTQRRAIGNSVASVSASEVTERVAVSNMQELLSARTPGVNFTRVSGNVGSGSPINIRGFSSIQLGNQPLIYIDGVRMDNSFGEGPLSQDANFFGPDNVLGAGLSRDAQGQSGSALDDLNPNDIESIEIIKGPAAATLYGTEASAGVIQIITKKGVEGAPQFNFSVRQGTQWLRDPVERTGPMFWCPDTDGDGDPNIPCAEDEINSFNVYAHERDVNGNDLFGYGRTQGYNLSVRGGTDAIRYFVSGGWDDDAGIVDWNWDNSFSFRSNLGVVFSENLSVDASVGFVDGETRYARPEPVYGGVWDLVQFGQGHEVDEEDRGFYAQPEEYATVESTRDYTRFNGSITTTHNYGEWLTQRFVVGMDRNWAENLAVTPRHPETTGGGPFAQFLGPFPGQSDGAVEFDRPIDEQLTVDYSLTASYDFNEALTFETSGGLQYYQEKSNTTILSGDQFPTPGQTNITTVIDTDDRPEHRVRESKSAGFYVQEQVGINNRIFVTGAVRADDNSAFGADFDLVYYPKVSATWVVSEESFWNLDFVSSLRLRGAWGESGRQPNAFDAVFQYEPDEGPGGTPAIRPVANRAGNPEIGPERSSEIEVGADFAFLEDRISGEFTYFSQKVTDALVPQVLAPSQAYTGNFSANAGELENWGWEAALNARVVETESFSFDLRLSGDHSDNEITKLSDEILGDENFREGWYYPNVALPTLRSADAVYDADGNLTGVTNVMCDGGKDHTAPGTAGGDALAPGGESISCTDAAALDKALITSRAFPTHTWSIAPTFTFFGDLQVFGLIDGSFGRMNANIDAEDRSEFGEFMVGVPNGPSANLRQDPYFIASKVNMQQLGFDDERWAGRYDADFWKLREVGIRYQIPDAWIEGMGADRASVSVSGRELWTIWRQQERDLSGVVIPDPEQVLGFSGEPNFSFRNMPALSSVSMTLRVSF